MTLKNLFFASAFMLVGSCIAVAETKIGDWTISRIENTRDCIAQRTYSDVDDKNLINTVVLGVVKDKVIIALGNEAWSWKEGEKSQTSLWVDDKEILETVDWTANGPTTLSAIIDDGGALQAVLANAEKLGIKFDNGGGGEFKIPGVGEVLKTLKTCV